MVCFSLIPSRWVGLTDEVQESDFRWLNNAPLYYNKIRGNEPNGKRVENCIAIKGDTQRFWDGSCDVKMELFLCSTLGKHGYTAKQSDTTLEIYLGLCLLFCQNYVVNEKNDA